MGPKYLCSIEFIYKCVDSNFIVREVGKRNYCYIPRPHNYVISYFPCCCDKNILTKATQWTKSSFWLICSEGNSLLWGIQTIMVERHENRQESVGGRSRGILVTLIPDSESKEQRRGTSLKDTPVIICPRKHPSHKCFTTFLNREVS